MKRTIFSILFFVLTAGLQIGFFSAFPLLRNSVNLFLVLTIVLAIHVSPRAALWWAFAAGIAMDLVSSEPFGLRSIVLMLIVWILDESYRRMFSHRQGISLVILYAIGVSIDILLRWGIWQMIRFFGYSIPEWFPDSGISWLFAFLFWNVVAIVVANFFLSRSFPSSDRSSMTVH